MAGQQDTGRLSAQIKQWRQELIDLSKRNRLINLPLKGRTTALEIVEPDLNTVLIRLLEQDGWRFHYPPLGDDESELDQTMLDALAAEDPDLDETLWDDELVTTITAASKLSSRLRNMAGKATSEYLDRGLRVLYLVAGVLEWSDGEGSDLVSPLVLIPVSLDRESPREPFRLVLADDDWQVNPALAVKLREEFGIELPDFPDGMEVDTYFASVSKLVQRQGWGVAQKVALATLSFAKETMYRDLLDNEAVIADHPIVRSLALGDQFSEGSSIDRISEEQMDSSYPPQVLHSILDADSTQRQCIIAAREGKSFVMDGPPGSGKSQTIANIIAELLAAKRSVLFVSEKAAALEVVWKRLEGAHLGEFVLSLHSHQATRKEVAQTLGRSVLRRVETAREPQPSVATLEKRREQLSTYAEALNEVRPDLGRSLGDVIGRCGILGDSPLANPPADIRRVANEGTLEALLEHASVLSGAWGPVERGEDFLWRDASSARDSKTRTQVEAELDDLQRKLVQLTEIAQAFSDETHSGLVQTFEECDLLVGLSGLLESRAPTPALWLTMQAEEFAALRNEALRLEAISDAHGSLLIRLESQSSAWSDLPLARADVSAAVDAVVAAVGDASTSSWTRAQLLDLHGHLGAAAEALAVVNEEASRLAEAFGVHVAALDRATAERLLELVALLSAEHRPERSWLDALVLQQARDAIRLVRPLVDQWRSLEGQVLDALNESVRTVDIASLYENPADPHLNVSRFSSRGRSNRKVIQAISRTGKVSPVAIAAIPIARSWQTLTSQLGELDDASVLGAYFAGPQTDLAAVDDALEKAERALKLAGSGADASALASQIARGAIDTAGVEGRGELLRAALHTADRELALLPGAGERFGPSMPFDQAIAQLAGSVNALDALDTVIAPFWAAEDFTMGEARELASDRETEAETTAEFESLSGGLELGPSFDGFATDWSSVGAQLEWAGSVRDLLGSPVNLERATELLHAVPNPGLGDLLADVRRRSVSLSELFNAERAAWIVEEMGGRLEDAGELVDVLRQSMDDLEEWRRYAQAIAGLESFGMTDAVEFALRERVNRDELGALFERTVLRAWVDMTIAEDPRCEISRSVERDTIVEEFRALDSQLSAAAAKKIIDICNGRRPASVVGEPAILKAEAEKSRKHQPVRELLAKTMRTSQDVKPCFMMSPLAVSQFLPSDMRFDVVIFDEASQVRPCDAINAIYRGNQLIVAGDERQLPPTSFFDKTVTDDSDMYEEDDTVEFESVLKLAKGAAGIDELPLRWHYRSRHESLITFSNRVFYNSELITYPGAVEKADHLGVEFFHVPEGVYERGGSRDNRGEAQKVVERVAHFASKYPNMTMGVVAFSAAQADRITLEIEALRRERPDLDRYFAEDRLDGFFVKNLESVQGDERDIIIFSIGYGRDQFGKLTMAFGPLNKEGGHRRLNVAVTRARQRVEVVSSITAADFDVHNTNYGVKCLRRYLDFAARGIVAFADDQVQGGEPESPFEIDVLQCITEMGFDVIPQVGQAAYRIDMAVRHPGQPGRYVLGIECDGAMYHSSRVARDRDRLRQEVLEGLGWTLHRIWGTSWYRQREAEKARLREAIEAALRGEPPAPKKKPEQLGVSSVPTIVEVEHTVGGEWSQPYVPYMTRTRSALDFTSSNIDRDLVDLCRVIVRELAPVHMDSIVETVKRVGGVERMGSARRDKVERAVARLMAKGDVQQDRFGFYWSEGSQVVFVRVPTADQPLSQRASNLVSPDEIKLAMFHLVKDARSLTVSDLRVRIARLFGWQRIGSEINLVLAGAYEELVASGSLEITSGSGEDAVVSCWDEDEPDLS